MKVTILTLFPQMFEPVLGVSIIGRAQKRNLLEVEFVDLRQFGEGPHQIVDDKPFGGGVGLVFKADILAKAINSITIDPSQKTRKILTSASGYKYTQAKARELSTFDHLIIVCGHYEGIDQRFIDKYIDEEISIGDYVLTGGEIPTMAIVDSVVRLIPGVIEKEEATQNESFENGLLEHPHYTRPQEFEGKEVPEVLISGNHQKIAQWRKEKSLEKTQKVRPDLLKETD